MNDLTFQGWLFFLKNSIFFPSYWYFLYWLIPLLVMGGVILYYRKNLTDGPKMWSRIGSCWKKIGLLLCFLVLLMYGLTVYSVPRFTMTPIGLETPMLVQYHQRLAGDLEGGQEMDDSERIIKLQEKYLRVKAADEELNRMIVLFYDDYPYIHSILFAFGYLIIFGILFIFKGNSIEHTKWQLNSLGK